jgi:hypothetical protein
MRVRKSENIDLIAPITFTEWVLFDELVWMGFASWKTFKNSREITVSL